MPDTNYYDVAVIGAGLMGSAAAKYLARMGKRVLLLGPDEENAEVHLPTSACANPPKSRSVARAHGALGAEGSDGAMGSVVPCSVCGSVALCPIAP